MKLIVSFSTTRFSLLKNSWKRSGADVVVNQSAENEALTGGLVIILDWESGICEAVQQVNQATGVAQTSKGYIVAADHKIYITNDQLRPLRVIERKQFNNLHSFHYFDGKLALTSSGIDTVIFLDESFNIYETWCAINHGYNVMQNGQLRSMEFEIDHSAIIYPSCHHTTHLNSVFYDEENESLYLTLFWQGQVVKFSKKNNSIIVLIDNLKFPHSLKKSKEGVWCFCDTGNNRVVTTTDWRSFYFINISGCSWLQDASPIGENRYIVADANNNRLIEIDSRGSLIKEWKFHKEWKVYETKIVDELV